MKRVFTALLVLTSMLFLVGVPQAHAASHHQSMPLFLQGWCNNEPCDEAYFDNADAHCDLMATTDNVELLYTTDNQNFGRGYILDSNIDNQNQSSCHAGWGSVALNSNVNANGLDLIVGSLNTKFYGSGAYLSQPGAILPSPMLSHDDELRTGCYSFWLSGTVTWSGHDHSVNIKMLSGPGC